MSPAKLSWSAAFLIAACGQSTDTQPPGSGTVTVGEIRVLSTPMFGRIRGIEVTTDGQLVILDSRIAPYVTVYHVSGDSVVARLGNSGEGPGELLSPDRIDLSPGTPQDLWVLQANRRILTRFKLGPQPTADLAVQFQSRYALDAAAMTDRGLLALGNFTDSGAAFIGDSQFSNPRGLGTAPYRPEDLPAVRVFDANRASFDRLDDRFAIAYRYAPQIQVLDVSGEHIAQFRSPVEVGRARKAFAESRIPNFSSDSSDIAFTQVALSEIGVFATFCGCRGSTLGNRDSLDVHFYDWNAGFQGLLKVPAPVTAMAVSRDGSRLYIATELPDPTIIQFQLSWEGTEQQ